MKTITTQRLVYAKHEEEIASLNAVLADIQAHGVFTPELQPTVDRILTRLDQLQTTTAAKLVRYDQWEERA